MSLFGPKSFDLKSNGVYVIIEVEPSVPFSEHTFKVIGASHSLEVAKKYAGANRIIKGPVPLFDEIPPQPKTIDPFGNPFKPDEIFNPKPFIFNPPELARPKPFNPDPFPHFPPTQFQPTLFTPGKKPLNQGNNSDFMDLC